MKNSLVLACNSTKSNTHPWFFLTFFKIEQIVPNRAAHHISSQAMNITTITYDFGFEKLKQLLYYIQV